MQLPPGHTRTPVTDADRAELEAVHQWAFAFPEPPPDEPLPPVSWVWERTTAVRRDGPDGRPGPIVATSTSLPFRVEVPGGAGVAAGGLSDVAVHPGHRRRGLGRALVTDHLAETAARGELFSLLVAAEASIYGRFGYGCATTRVSLTVPRGAALREVPGAEAVRVDFAAVDAGRHTDLVSRLHARVGAGRPGWALRESPALAARALLDPPSSREGREQLKIAVATTADGEEVGYALFSRRDTWQDSIPTGTLDVRAAGATGPAAARALWGALLDLDLMATTRIGTLAPDDALLHQLVDLRAAAPRVRDNTWLRLVDVPGALAARRYATDLDVVLDVTDPLLAANAGRWRITAAAGAPAAAVRTEDAADLALDVRDLSAAYLGGTALTALAGAGLVRELTPGAAARTSTAFTSARAPFCDWVF